MSFLDKIRQGLSKTASAISGVFQGYTEVDEDFYEELEDRLIMSDVGVECASEAVEQLRNAVRRDRVRTSEEARVLLKNILADILVPEEVPPLTGNAMTVILVIGVNGVGKTTTIGKLANQLRSQGKRVLLCAADTFRAAAADQLEIWANRSGVEIVRQDEGADPAAVVYDALSAAKARGCDVVLCDTAGRLHNKANLMNELNKISRVIDRELPNAHRETLLVLDGTTGQNGLVQAKQFREAAGVTGIVLTKLDGTAKGGVVIAVARELGLPVRYIGVGEGMDDLLPFSAEEFVEALL